MVFIVCTTGESAFAGSRDDPVPLFLCLGKAKTGALVGFNMFAITLWLDLSQPLKGWSCFGDMTCFPYPVCFVLWHMSTRKTQERPVAASFVALRPPRRPAERRFQGVEDVPSGILHFKVRGQRRAGAPVPGAKPDKPFKIPNKT